MLAISRDERDERVAEEQVVAHGRGVARMQPLENLLFHELRAYTAIAVVLHVLEELLYTGSVVPFLDAVRIGNQVMIRRLPDPEFI